MLRFSHSQPDRSPDLSAIKHTLDQLRCQFRPSANMQDLKSQLQLWADLMQEWIQWLYVSVLHCMHDEQVHGKTPTRLMLLIQ